MGSALAVSVDPGAPRRPQGPDPIESATEAFVTLVDGMPSGLCRATDRPGTFYPVGPSEMARFLRVHRLVGPQISGIFPNAPFIHCLQQFNCHWSSTDQHRRPRLEA